jgi:KDO2-lipid IV(A) lauroyltransferase
MGVLKNLVKWFFWRHLRPVVALSPINAVVALDAALARLLGAGSGRASVMRSELERSGFTPDEARRASEAAVLNHMNSQMKLCYLKRVDGRNVSDLIPVSGIDRLDAALERGRGAILLNPHFGPFMLIMPALGHRGYRVNQVALQGEPIVGRRGRIEGLEYRSKFDAIEGNMPVRFINAADGVMALRDVVRALKANESVLFASTGRGGSAWHGVEFLGRPATFNTVPFKTALRTGAALMPVFVMDEPPLARVVIEDRLEVREADTPEAALERYVSLLEAYVRRHPEHFAYFLSDMRIKSSWDDHPFFLDYPAGGGPKRGNRAPEMV